MMMNENENSFASIFSMMRSPSYSVEQVPPWLLDEVDDSAELPFVSPVKKTPYCCGGLKVPPLKLVTVKTISPFAFVERAHSGLLSMKLESTMSAGLSVHESGFADSYLKPMQAGNVIVNLSRQSNQGYNKNYYLHRSRRGSKETH